MVWFNLRGCGPLGAFGAGMEALAAAIVGNSAAAEEGGDALRREYLVQFDEVLAGYLSPQKLRRIDRFGRMALTALFLCLDDAGVVAAECTDYGLIIGSGFGPAGSSCQFKDTLLDHGFMGASPTAFTKSVHNQAAANIAMQLGLHGSVATLCQQWFPVQSALQLGCMWLSERRVKRVLVGVLDEWLDFFSFCQGLAVASPGGATDATMPGTAYFAGNRRTAEGAAFFLLEDELEGDCPVKLSLPEFAESALQTDYARDYDKIIGADSLPHAGRRSQLDGSANEQKYNVFRNIYGSFPTAAGLDLCALAGGLQDGQSGLCIESGGGEHALLRLKSTRNTDSRRGMV